MWLFLLLIAVPLTEIALFIVIGDEIGLAATLTIVVLTALIGAVTLRRQGMQTFSKLQTLRADEEAPVVLIEGLLIAASGLLLLTPGFLTDTIGFLFLIPPVRTALARRAVSSAIVYAARGAPPRGGAEPRPGPSDPFSADPRARRHPPAEPGAPTSGPDDIEDATVIDESGPRPDKR